MPLKYPKMAAFGVGLGLLAAPLAAGDNVPGSAKEVQPLLIGAKVPSVAVTDIDGKTVDINKLVASKPAVLIFYRGGW